MDPQRLLKNMCARHGVDFESAELLVPLLERALASPQKVRDRILYLVDDNLARKAGGDPRATPQRVLEDLDDEVLRSVARVLHNWTPSGKVIGLGGMLPGLFPDGIAPDDGDDD